MTPALGGGIPYGMGWALGFKNDCEAVEVYPAADDWMEDTFHFHYLRTRHMHYLANYCVTTGF